MASLTAALTARMATRGVTVALEVEATDIVVRDGRAVAVATTTGEVDADVVVCAIDPADAARTRAVRRAHDADDAAGRLPRRPLGTGARPAARGGRARRPHARRPLRRPGAGRRCGVHGARPRQAGRGHPQGPGPAPARPARRPGHPGRPEPAGPGAAVAHLAVRRAVGGPRHSAATARSAHPDRGRVRRRRARHARQPGCRSWDCRPRWWRRWWDRREPPRRATR